jgi:uncharacterized BrkB/YihY/UPF0761 family membrane protein
MAHEPISTTYFITASYQNVCVFVCLYVYAPNVARQRISKSVIGAMNTHATGEELFDASFSLRLCRIKGK